MFMIQEGGHSVKKVTLLILLAMMTVSFYGCSVDDEPDDNGIIDDDTNDNDDEIPGDDNGDDDNGNGDDDNGEDDNDNGNDNDNGDEPHSAFDTVTEMPLRKNLYQSVHSEQNLDNIPSTLALHFPTSSEIPYVPLESITELFSELYVNGDFTYLVEDDIITIDHAITYDSTIFDDTVHTLTIDTTTHEVTFSSRQFGQYDLYAHYTPVNFEFLSMERTDYEPFTINLSTYDYALIIEEDIAYIPFDLSNILFGSDRVFLYYNVKEIYLQPTNNLNPVVRNSALSTTRVSDEIMQQTLQHMRILFNYFHGVHEYGDGEDFETFIRHYKTRFLFAPDHYRMIYANLARLDDLHTRYLFNGSWSSSITVPPSTDFERSQRTKTFNDALESATENDLCFDGVRYTHLEDDIGRIDLSNILPSTPEAFIEALDAANTDAVKHLVIDLSCNTGGSLLHTLEILSVLTDQPLDLVIRDAADKSIQTIQYQSTFDSSDYDFQFYVLTSPITYSAGSYLSYLMQTYLDATLIGQPTSGGASSVRIATVPSGAFFTMSSTLQLRTITGESLEYGVGVDYDLDLLSLKDTEQLVELITSLNP